MDGRGQAGHPPGQGHFIPQPPPLIGRLQGSIPVLGERARRTLWSLALGHLAVLVSTLPVAALIVGPAATDDAGGSTTMVMFAVGALALAVGQILSVHKLRAVASTTTGQIDVDRIARSLRRSGWAAGFGLYAIMFAVQFLLTAPSWPLLFALFLLLTIAQPLLEYSYAGWVHRCLNGSDEKGAVAAFRLLPPGVAPRIRNGQPVAAVVHGIFGGIAAMLLVATIVTESLSASGISPTMLVQIVAAAAATAVPLLQIRAPLLVRAAVTGDWVHLPSLRRAGASFIRAGTATAPLAALVIASIVVAPAAPMVAIGRAALLVYVLSVAVMQFASLSSIRIGDFPKRWIPAALGPAAPAATATGRMAPWHR
jgi:hypothetical protein